jgi:preprotein translocase subunit SecG
MGAKGLGVVLCLILMTVFCLMVAVAIPVVMTQTESGYNMSNNTSAGNYSPYADQVSANRGFIQLIDIVFWVLSLILTLETVGAAGLMLYGGARGVGGRA